MTENYEPKRTEVLAEIVTEIVKGIYGPCLNCLKDAPDFVKGFAPAFLFLNVSPFIMPTSICSIVGGVVKGPGSLPYEILTESEKVVDKGMYLGVIVGGVSMMAQLGILFPAILKEFPEFGQMILATNVASLLYEIFKNPVKRTYARIQQKLQRTYNDAKQKLIERNSGKQNTPDDNLDDEIEK